MPDASYKDDRAFGDKFMPEVKSILGRVLLTPDYQDEDMERNTDLIVLTMANKRIAVRIRRYKYYSMPDDSLRCYGKDEFTIRYSKNSGHITEFEKLMGYGFGDYFFYGFADEAEEKLIQWNIIDLQSLRRFLYSQLCSKNWNQFIDGRLHTVNANKDKFLVFKLNEIPGGIIESSDNWKKVIA